MIAALRPEKGKDGAYRCTDCGAMTPPRVVFEAFVAFPSNQETPDREQKMSRSRANNPESPVFTGAFGGTPRSARNW